MSNQRLGPHGGPCAIKSSVLPATSECLSLSWLMETRTGLHGNPERHEAPAAALANGGADFEAGAGGGMFPLTRVLGPATFGEAMATLIRGPPNEVPSPSAAAEAGGATVVSQMVARAARTGERTGKVSGETTDKTTDEMTGHTIGEMTVEMTGMTTGVMLGEMVPCKQQIAEKSQEMGIEEIRHGKATAMVIETGVTASGMMCETVSEVRGVTADNFRTTVEAEANAMIVITVTGAVGTKIEAIREAMQEAILEAILEATQEGTQEPISRGTVVTHEAVETIVNEMQIAEVTHIEAAGTTASVTASVTGEIGTAALKTGAAAPKTKSMRPWPGGRSLSLVAVIRMTGRHSERMTVASAAMCRRLMAGAAIRTEVEIGAIRATGEGPNMPGQRGCAARATLLRLPKAQTRWGSGCRAWTQPAPSCATCLPFAASSLDFESSPVPWLPRQERAKVC